MEQPRERQVRILITGIAVVAVGAIATAFLLVSNAATDPDLYQRGRARAPGPEGPVREQTAERQADAPLAIRLSAVGRALGSRVSVSTADGVVRSCQVMRETEFRGTISFRVPQSPPPVELIVGCEGFLPVRTLIRYRVRALELKIFAPARLRIALPAIRAYEAVVRLSSANRTWSKPYAPGSVVVFDDLPASEFSVGIIAPPSLTLLRREFALEWGESKTLDMSALSVSSVTGRVVASDGARLQNAKVTARKVADPTARGLEEAECVTGDDGGFRLVLKAGCHYRLDAKKPGFLSHDRADFFLERFDSPSVELVLRPTGRLRGRVTNSAGVPLVGARIVSSVLREDESEALCTTTDRRGRFVVAGRSSTDPSRVTVSKAGFATAQLVVEPTRSDLLVVLPHETPLVVSVTDAVTGQPLPDATLQVATNGGGAGDDGAVASLETEILQDGRFEIRGYSNVFGATLTASAEGYRAATKQVRERGQAIVLLPLQAVEGVTVQGVVKSRWGRPQYVAGVTIRDPGDPRSLRTYRTDRAGRFVMAGLRPGVRYRFKATSLDQALVSSEETFLAMEGLRLDIIVGAAGSLIVRLESQRGEMAIGGVQCRVDSAPASEDGTADAVPYMAPRVFRNGILTVEGLAPGIYALTILSRSHAPRTLSGVRVRSGQKTVLGPLRMVPMTTVQLEVPSSLDTSRLAAFAVASNGRVFRILGPPSPASLSGPLPNGEYTVVVQGLGVPTCLQGTIRIADQNEVTRRIDIPTGGRLRIQVRSRLGLPVAGAILDVTADAPPPLDRILVSRVRNRACANLQATAAADPWIDRDFVTGADGILIVRGLAPGGYEVRIGDRSVKLSVRAGSTTSIGIETP